MDIGDGLCAVFKIESHNHPSFIEPYQGAATGVGGIIRDIFTMGARPIGLLNALRFGSLDRPLARRIFAGVVAGVGGYGNSIGIPTIGGEIYFDDKYAGNPLVNVLCLGLRIATTSSRARRAVKAIRSFTSAPRPAATASMARRWRRRSLTSRRRRKRPAVQVGDPFMEKLLMEACLEVMKTGAVVGIQDMGAAGLTCATSEMSSRGGSGMDVEVTLVPQRETGMAPYEIMLSESQERMLLVVEKGREREVVEVFEKWDLHAVEIGTVTSTGRVRIFERGTLVADVPTRALTDEAPLYRRPMSEPEWQRRVQRLPFDADWRAGRADAGIQGAAGVAWSSPASAGLIGSTTTRLGPTPSRGRERRRALCGSRGPLAVWRSPSTAMAAFCYLDPYRGAMLAVAESARNVACAGAEPIGATNNLNFGNPERPEIMWQLAEAVRGIGDACRALDIPITGGNVSLYNETEGEAIYPTPVLGVVGLLDDATKTVTRQFQIGWRSRGRCWAIIEGSWAAASTSRSSTTRVAGAPPALDLDARTGASASGHRRHSNWAHRVGARLCRRRAGHCAGRVLLRHEFRCRLPTRKRGRRSRGVSRERDPVR